MDQRLKEVLRKSLYVHKELTCDELESAEYRWQNKEVLDKCVIYNGDTLDNIIYKDIEVSLSNEITLSNSSLKLVASTDIENVDPRPWPVVKIKLPFKDITKYNRVSCDIYIEAEGYQNFYYQFFIGNNTEREHHSPSLKPNEWNHVVFEITDLLRDDVEYFVMGPWLMGKPDEALSKYIVYLDNVCLEVVKEDRTLGYDLGSDLGYSHIGYLKDARKCVISSCYYPLFSLFKSGVKVFEGTPSKTFDNFYELDFSSLKEEGIFKLIYGNQEIKDIKISDDCYDESIIASLNFLRLLRCGVDIPGVHSACHLNCRSFDKDGGSVPIFGGWHDAGDVSQFEIPTAEMSHALVDLAKITSDFYLKERLKEEARVGLHWLLQTKFKNGERALAITYNIWRKNYLAKDNLTPFKNVSEEGCFENFLSSAALASAYLLFLGDDDVFAKWCLREAIDDFNQAIREYKENIYSKRWGPTIDSVTLGHAITASCELYKATNDYSFLSKAKEYSKIVLACQEKEYIGDDIKLRGFFYEDPAHRWVLTYEHRGHEQSPIQGLVNLCKVLPNDELYSEWINGINLYTEYVKDSINLTNPYGLLPGHVYILDKINPCRFTIPSSYGTLDDGMKILRNQVKQGLKLNNDTYLRTFPVAVQRRGYHATLLSKVKAVSEIYSLTKDLELRDIITRQIEWIFGYNPFASSTMYGVGHNYHPLYVAFSRQMVGSLPVGIKTKGDLDLPFWPTRDHAVYKEIWGHTTGKYLWILADLLRK